MRRYVFTGGALLAAALAAPARACPFSEAMTPLLFDALPVVAPGDVAARIEVLPRDPRNPGMRARIVAILVGEYAGSNLRLEPSYLTSCDRFPQAGETGIVVGRVISSSPEALVIDPLRAPSAVQRGEYKIEVIPTPR